MGLSPETLCVLIQWLLIKCWREFVKSREGWATAAIYQFKCSNASHIFHKPERGSLIRHMLLFFFLYYNMWVPPAVICGKNQRNYVAINLAAAATFRPSGPRVGTHPLDSRASSAAALNAPPLFFCGPRILHNSSIVREDASE